MKLSTPSTHLGKSIALGFLQVLMSIGVIAVMVMQTGY